MLYLLLPRITMPDEPAQTPKRHWWAITRVQGVALMAVGVGMLFVPAAEEVAEKFITAGLAWFLGGVNAKMTRG